MDLNCVSVTGRLTRDVEEKTTASGTNLATFGIAVGGYKDKVCFLDCTAFGKQAEQAVKFLRKGAKVGVKGSLNQESWTTVEGHKRSKISVNVDSFCMLESRRQEPEKRQSTADITGENDGDMPF